MRTGLMCILLAVMSCRLVAAEAPAERFAARDTLKLGEMRDDASRQMLGQIAWTPGGFDVTVAPGAPGDSGITTDADALVTFASPRPSGAAGGRLNTVVLEWYKARAAGGGGAPAKAPAMLTLHILDNRLLLERGIARAMAQRGVHCFIMHDPGWGLRRVDSPLNDGAVFFERATQAVADARRSRDAIAALPGVDAARISLQGASLGGFIASCAGAVDGCFENVFIMLAGGNLYDMLKHGRNEAQRVRRALEASGYTGQKLRDLCGRIEPTHVAHRLNPASTWLFSAFSDQVVPMASARALASAAGLPDAHHHWIGGDHYSCIVHLPWLVNYMSRVIHATPPHAPGAGQ